MVSAGFSPCTVVRCVPLVKPFVLILAAEARGAVVKWAGVRERQIYPVRHEPVRRQYGAIACRYGMSVHLIHLRLPGTVFCRHGGLEHTEPTT